MKLTTRSAVTLIVSATFTVAALPTLCHAIDTVPLPEKPAPVYRTKAIGTWPTPELLRQPSRIVQPATTRVIKPLRRPTIALPKVRR